MRKCKVSKGCVGIALLTVQGVKKVVPMPELQFRSGSLLCLGDTDSPIRADPVVPADRGR